MKTATLNRPKNPTSPSLGAGTPSDAHRGTGSPPDDTLRECEIHRLAETDRSIRTASTIAGVGLLAMSVLSALGYLVAVKGIVVPGNAARTARNIAGHKDMFRFGILNLYLVAALDVVVAWALHRVFRPVSDALSKVAAWLRVAYAGFFAVAISQLVGALRFPARALQHVNDFTKIWDAGLVLFGLNLLVLAYLAYRSGYVPRLLSSLLGIAGFGYVFDSVVRTLVRGSASDISAITGMGEFVFALWLVIRGRRINVSASELHDNTVGVSR